MFSDYEIKKIFDEKIIEDGVISYEITKRLSKNLDNISFTKEQAEILDEVFNFGNMFRYKEWQVPSLLPILKRFISNLNNYNGLDHFVSELEDKIKIRKFESSNLFILNVKKMFLVFENYDFIYKKLLRVRKNIAIAFIDSNPKIVGIVEELIKEGAKDE